MTRIGDIHHRDPDGASLMYAHSGVGANGKRGRGPSDNQALDEIERMRTCPICGYPELSKPPVSPRTGNSSLEYCDSCGFQFGFHNGVEGITYEQWREDWIRAGMPWRGGGVPRPEGWDPVEQLRNLG